VNPVRDADSLVRAPFGVWMLVADTCVAWVHSAELVGAYAWGRPSEEDVRKTLDVFDRFTQLAGKFDAILDGSEVEKVEPGALLILLDWIRRRLPELEERVRRRMGVITNDVAGITLAGITPAMGGPNPVRVVFDAREAFRAMGVEPLCDEVRAIVDGVRGLTPTVARVRQLLARDPRLALEEAARELGLSVRSLQRELRDSGRSYREEQKEARFHIAEQLLDGDEKLVTVASRLGLTEAALTRLVRERTGLTPGELRRRARGQ
jgi:AraC-like DNA-binding protein